ncbi:hypothetical protein F2P81_007695 [Scophthalmus maximus]|uniref:Uncharacterized protein n=1 Tax=Scophthalmus maximus TaxID=52904 RepID=A0A6A4T640_SCOMX|nr:hypothetical protein F2P81_007695 [Scophthalmus maximus]
MNYNCATKLRYENYEQKITHKEAKSTDQQYKKNKAWGEARTGTWGWGARHRTKGGADYETPEGNGYDTPEGNGYDTAEGNGYDTAEGNGEQVDKIRNPGRQSDR